MRAQSGLHKSSTVMVSPWQSRRVCRQRASSTPAVSGWPCSTSRYAGSSKPANRTRVWKVETILSNACGSSRKRFPGPAMRVPFRLEVSVVPTPGR